MKTRLRERLKKARTLMSPEDLRDHSNRLVQSLVTLLHSKGNCTAALYYPYAGEPDLLSLPEQEKLQSFIWALPVCITDEAPHLRFARYATGDLLEKGVYGINVPVKKDWLNPDLLVIPCLAGNRKGYRLGYGAGWYDRTLAGMVHKPTTVGVLWDSALVEEDFQEAHDQPLDWIVTPSEQLRVAD